MLITTPKTRAPTFSSRVTASRSWSRVVLPCRATTIAPSVAVAMTAASATGSSGGASTMTMSKSSRSRFSRSWVTRDCRISVGFGGLGPLARKFSPLASWTWIASSSSAVPTSTLVSPTAPSRSSRLATRGRRRSPSTSSTLRPAWARATARLAAVTVLPSPGTALVMTRLRGCCSRSRNCRLVRSSRNASVRDAKAPRSVSSGLFLIWLSKPMLASTGALLTSSTCSRLLTDAVEDVAGDGQADAEHQPDHAGHREVQQRCAG